MTRTKRRSRSGKKPTRHRPTAETRAAEVVTICWMLTVLLTLACEIAGIAANLYVWQVPDAARIELLAGILRFAAVALGVLALMMMPVVWRTRRHPPPRAVGIFAVIVCATPPITLALRLLAAT